MAFGSETAPGFFSLRELKWDKKLMEYIQSLHAVVPLGALGNDGSPGLPAEPSEHRLHALLFKHGGLL